VVSVPAGSDGLTPTAFLEELTRSRLVAIVRGTDADAAEAATVALFEEGITIVEVALTTPDALGVIARVRAMMPKGALLGAGTVLTPADVDAVRAAGADFIVTPAVAPSVEAAAAHGMPVCAGAFTPTEAHLARLMGATVVKLFPASSAGPGHLRALRDPFPDLPLMAVGGVGLEQAGAYLDAGAVAVGVGGPLLGDAAAGGSLLALRDRARGFARLADWTPSA
jgi:2-dehydro-3-deoxyphosphogluconate aldolase / (4S)-4-hydroxy-2-oxoglutarate aldolase